jgi:hypothetical protein
MIHRAHNFKLEFDAANKILRLSIYGEVADQTLLDGYTLLERCYDHLGACNCIVDYTTATRFEITSVGVRYLSSKPPIFPMDCVTLNIAPEDLIYGMARMFQGVSEDRPNFRVVRSMDEALHCMGVRKANFSPIELSSDDAA